jgi:hypothetical protein
VEVVVVVATVPVILVSSPDAFPVILTHLLDFLPHMSLHFSHCVDHLLQQLHLSDSYWIYPSRWGVQRIHLWLRLVNNPLVVVVGR